jgi:hypothetical protein
LWYCHLRDYHSRRSPSTGWRHPTQAWHSCWNVSTAVEDPNKTVGVRLNKKASGRRSNDRKETGLTWNVDTQQDASEAIKIDWILKFTKFIFWYVLPLPKQC